MRILFVLLFGAAMLFACDMPSDPNVEEAEQQLTETTQEIEAKAEQTMKDIGQEWDSLNTEVNKELAMLDAEIAEATDEAKADLQKQKDQLVEWQKDMNKRLESNYQDVKSEWDSFVKETRQTMKKIEEDLQSDS